MNRLLLSVSAIALLTGCPKPDPVLDVHPFCQLPGAQCLPPCVGEGCPVTGELSWCCSYDPENGCALTDLLSDCDPTQGYAIWCEYGRSIPQNFPDGTSGFECFG